MSDDAADKPTHSPEPWKFDLNDDEFTVHDADNSLILACDPRGGDLPSRVNFERIEACIRACEGIPTETLAQLKFLEFAEDEIAKRLMAKTLIDRYNSTTTRPPKP